jgi:DNA-binding YbaB/EbfC family protein
MRDKFENARREIAGLEGEGRAGGGLVVVVIDGAKRVKKVAVAPEAAGDLPMLEDLIAAAINGALADLEQKTRDTMGGALPPGLANFF